MLRNFLYISETKIDLYFPQIPKSFFQSLSKEVEVNFGIFKAGIKGEPTQHPNTNIEKLLIIENYLLEKEDLGSFDFPGQFVLDECNLSWRVFEGWPDTSLVYFSGVTSTGVEVGLGGSSWHLMGGKRPDSARISSSEPGFLLQAIENYQETAKLPKLEDESLQRRNAGFKRRGYELSSMRELRGKRPLNLFHIKTLAVTIDFDPNSYYLGTPLYVEKL
jgi:hypothetical protein